MTSTIPAFAHFTGSKVLGGKVRPQRPASHRQRCLQSAHLWSETVTAVGPAGAVVLTAGLSG